MKQSCLRPINVPCIVLAVSLSGLTVGGCRGVAPDSKVEPRTQSSADPGRKNSLDSAPSQPSDLSYTDGKIQASPIASHGDDALDASEQVSVPSSVTGAHTDAKDMEPGQILANGQYLVKNAGSKKCLHVPDGKRENNVKLVQFTCDISPENKFMIDFVEHKYYRFTNLSTSKSLQITDELAQDEATVEQADYLGQPYQQWILAKQEDGSFTIKPRENLNLCLDVIYGSDVDNAGLQIWRECTGVGQKWTLVPVY